MEIRPFAAKIKNVWGTKHMSDSEGEDARLCVRCIGDERFANWIKDNGVKAKCDFSKSHGRSSATVTVKVFAIQVDEYFRETYQLGEEFPYFDEDSDKVWYKPEGQPYKEILAEELECDEDLVEAISEHLPDASDRDLSQGDEAFYDDSYSYESIAGAKSRSKANEEDYWYENPFTVQWNQFCETVKFARRFFKTKELLDSLFGKPEEYHEGAVRPIYELKAGAKLFRSRLLDEGFTERRLEENSALELSAPPKERTRAGRMNVEYIPAFYAAFSDETAIAELRPSIGDRLAVGEFVLNKGIKVFDFTVFSKLTDEKRHEAHSHTRYDFITQMEDEISKPILPYEKQREYIATQIVAEYLREHFDCDAVIFRSSMHKTTTADNRNIVIFHKGSAFVGRDGLLSLSKHNVFNVDDVIFSTSVDLF